jgi:hypothetical protein
VRSAATAALAVAVATTVNVRPGLRIPAGGRDSFRAFQDGPR